VDHLFLLTIAIFQGTMATAHLSPIQGYHQPPPAVVSELGQFLSVEGASHAMQLHRTRITLRYRCT